MTHTSSHILLDVRTREEYAQGFVPNSINIPLAELSISLEKLPVDAHISVFCASGARAMIAVEMLTRAGYTNVTCVGSWLDVSY